MLNKNKEFISESQETVNGLQAVEANINKDESNMLTKILQIARERQELQGEIHEAEEFRERLEAELAKQQSAPVTEENVMEVVRPKTELYELWLKQEAKRKSRESCMLMIRKLYENRKISLEVLVNETDQLASKEFVNIYKKNKLELLIKREEKGKV